MIEKTDKERQLEYEIQRKDDLLIAVYDILKQCHYSSFALNPIALTIECNGRQRSGLDLLEDIVSELNL